MIKLALHFLFPQLSFLSVWIRVIRLIRGSLLLLAI